MKTSLSRFGYCTFMLLTFYCSPSVATVNLAPHFNQAAEEAKISVTSSLNNNAVQNFNAEAYCKDQACINEMRNPSQQHYFGNDATLETDGQQGLLTDPNAANIKDGFSTRPQHTLDPNDPALINAKGYMDNSYAISHGISNKYIDCEGGQVCQYIDTTRQCTEPTGNGLTCNQVPYPINVSTIAKQQTFTHKTAVGEDMFSSRPLAHVLKAGITVTGISTSGGLKIMTGSGHHSSQGSYLINGAVVKTITIPATPCGDWVCSYTLPPIHIPLNQTFPSNKLELSFSTFAGFIAPNTTTTVHWKEDNIEMGWRDECPTIPQECSRQSQVCIEGAGTRTINGVNVTMACWKKQSTFTCQYPNTCTPLLSRGKVMPEPSLICKVAKRQCKVSLLGQCLVFDVGLDCEEQRCENRNLQCGESFFCIDGDCYEGEGETNADFSQSASALAALGEAAEDITADNITIFTGKPAFCDKKPMGLSDCCADDGWGNDLGLTECSTEEKGLAKAKEKKLTIELGEYCAEKVLGVCIRKKKSYCQFDSMMSRIIQEQGKQQLGLNFGSKKDPDCTGITPEQLQQLDFSHIDFSDFYSDLQTGMELPDMQEVQDRIKDKYGDK